MKSKVKRMGIFKEIITSFGHRGQIDGELFIIIILMLMFGLVMVASASSITALYGHGDSMFFLKKQVLWAVVGFIFMLGISKIDYHVWTRPKVLIPAVIIIWGLMLAVAFVGTEISGARRWLEIGPFSFQPSELGKIAVILLFATFCSKLSDEAFNNFKASCLLPLGLMGVYVLPLLLQPHKSATFLIVLVCLTILFASGVKIRYYMSFLPLGIPAVFYIIFKDGYSANRLLSFLDPFKDASGSGWQAVQSLYAIGSGGLFGLGLGRSRQKFLYLPEPQNDFIFSIICEELGFIGAALVIILFLALFVRCIKIAVEAPDRVGTLISIGMTALIMIQVIINVAVVTGVVPVTGMPLPFFSAGGTTLMFTLAGMGILLNISRYSKKAMPTRTTDDGELVRENSRRSRAR